MDCKKIGRPKKETSPKGRFTLYLCDDVLKKFNELYAFRVMTGSKDSKSDVICDALCQLHNKEFDNIKGGR